MVAMPSQDACAVEGGAFRDAVTERNAGPLTCAGGRAPGSSIVQAGIVRILVGAVLIVGLVFGLWELAETALFAGASPCGLRPAHLARGIVTSLCLAGWAAVMALRSRQEVIRSLEESHGKLLEDLRRKNDRLAESDAFTQVLLDSIPDRITVVGPDLTVLRANQAATLRYGDAVVGRKCFAAFECRQVPCDECPALRTFAHGHPSTNERTAPSGRCSEILALETYPMGHTAGAPRAVVEVARVVTEQKRLQVQLLSQARMAAFGGLAAGVAHDIGNPLACVSAELQLLEGEHDRERIESSLSVVRAQVERMARSLRELAGLMRRPRDRTTSVCLCGLVSDVLRLVRHDPRARRVRMESTLDPELPPVLAVEDDLVHVLLNLLLNALDAVPEGGRITVVARRAERGVEIEVADTGPGMTAEVVAHAFEPFFTTKDCGRGSGLGLFLAREVVESLGGEIRVASEPGCGARLTVWLPSEAPSPDAASVASAAPVDGEATA
jgi:signal transduction histidine kinase